MLDKSVPYLAALILGALATLAFAPFSYPVFSLISVAGAYLLLQDRSAFKFGLSYGSGFFLGGISWVYVSIHYHGGMSSFVAALMTLLFACALGLLFAVQFWLYRKLSKGAQNALLFAGIWILFEWLRSWFLTGFPWLLLGYAWIDTPLKNLAPIGGVWLVSAAVLTIALLAATTIQGRSKLALMSAVILYASSYLLAHDWTQKSSDDLSVTLIQPNISQSLKWDINSVDAHILNLMRMTETAPQSDLIIWPETAIPKLINKAIAQLSPLTEQLEKQNRLLLSGFPRAVWRDDEGRWLYHNSIGTLTGRAIIYDKQRLVPFGEYLPFEEQLRGVIEFFNLPMSSFSLPSGELTGLDTDKAKIAAAICYEIAYPELVSESAKNRDIILTLSNDTWFTGSHAPAQHFEIARMRAVENGRWVIRATNNGISGLINQQGEIVATAPTQTQTTLVGKVEFYTGQTPYQRFGIWPVLLLALLAILSQLHISNLFRSKRK
ncbi:apolipoprotein N-acyltransferase [Marinobacterium sp. LSUCC0821]|uniref:apolipoprotein N-acyltransferase n=1 Tax=Marinobacterium sp. LSUCC0821 TaxID=2668067 RepID=UPI0014517474|nr:apolipoprotein N-acyltransferase [Marinobacterium sp. LSUCC0821]QJD71552.1 apolipoprotein N-acyltransferase [Marinobacterium sp. LSUCC0821]